MDVFLLDLEVPTGPENSKNFPILTTIPRLVQSYPEMAILAISMHHEHTLIQATLAAGASGYILKNDYAAIQELASIIRSVANQGIYLSAGIRNWFFNHVIAEDREYAGHFFKVCGGRIPEATSEGSS